MCFQKKTLNHSVEENMDDNHMEFLKIVCDGVSLCTVVATLAGMLPSIAALASIIWTVIRIYETKTFREFRKRGRNENRNIN